LPRSVPDADRSVIYEFAMAGKNEYRNHNQRLTRKFYVFKLVLVFRGRDKMRYAFWLLILLAGPILVWPGTALASGSYDFCVRRSGAASTEVLHARLSYGDIDPTKEVARVIISQRFKRVDDTEVNVTDYEAKVCPGTQVSELKVELSGEQIQDIAGALASGDITKAATDAATATAGTVVTVVEVGGGVVGTVVKTICGWLGCN
jgi:hypothetical protein